MNQQPPSAARTPASRDSLPSTCTHLTRAPWLSIVMPVHDEAAGIVQTLIALNRLRAGGDCEVIVVDGGSTDGTPLTGPSAV